MDWPDHRSSAGEMRSTEYRSTKSLCCRDDCLTSSATTLPLLSYIYSMWNIIGRYMYSVTLCRVDIAMLTSVANHQHHCVCGCDTVNLFIVSSLFFLIEGQNIIYVQLNVYVNVDRQPRGAAVFYTYFIVAVNVKRVTETVETVVSYSSVVFAQDCGQCANSKQFALKVNKMHSYCAILLWWCRYCMCSVAVCSETCTNGRVCVNTDTTRHINRCSCLTSSGGDVCQIGMFSALAPRSCEPLSEMLRTVGTPVPFNEYHRA